MPLINYEIELDLRWARKCLTSEITRTPEEAGSPGSNPPALSREAATTTNAMFQINNAKLYASVDNLSINDNIKFLEHLKQGFRRTISWNKLIQRLRISKGCFYFHSKMMMMNLQ